MSTRSPSWKWWICGLLLLATMLNYMDRQTLSLMALRIMDSFQLDERDYGQLESAFAFAFALGYIITGWMVDRWNVRWIFPLMVMAWSVAGFATGLATGFLGLLLCRFGLGLAEAGNWPSALRTTQRILPPEQRTLGNGILQSGASLGAILAPWIVLPLAHWTGTWRYSFMAVGAVGMIWVMVWLWQVRSADLALEQIHRTASLMNILGLLIALQSLDFAVHILWGDGTTLAPGLRAALEAVSLEPRLVPLLVKVLVTVCGIVAVAGWLRRATGDDTALPRTVFFRRFWVLAAITLSINITWHFFRAWLPLFLQKQHGYSESNTGSFVTAFYIASDLGALAVGFTTLRLTRAGLSVHGSRTAVFLVCALLTTLSTVAAVLPAGWLLLAVLLVIGFAALGLFPVYYSFMQELSFRNQGKVNGALGCINWLGMALLHELAGDSIKRTGSYSQGVSLAGLAPLVGVAALVCFWGHAPGPQQTALPTKPHELTPPPDGHIKENSTDRVRR